MYKSKSFFKSVIILVVILLFLYIIITLMNGDKGKLNFSDSSSSIDEIYDKFIKKFNFYNKGKNLENVDMIYSIVMPDRKDYMINKLNQMNINYTLFDAVTPADLNSSDYTSLVSEQRLIDRKTRLPVQLSFTMCYLDAIKKGYTTIIVFEDDLVINADNKLVSSSIEEFKNSDFVMFYMGYCELNCNQNFNKNEYKYLVNVPDYSKLWCCHSICYKVSFLQELINYIYPMNNDFDIKITEFLKNKNYKVCIPKKVYYDQDKNLGTNNETVYENGSLILSGPTCII